MSEILLQTKALTKQYGHQKAVDNVDIHIKKGAIYGFIGRNGAGKTTCMRMIGGLAKPTSGEISMFGYAGKDLSKVRSRVGCLIEAPGVYPNMTAKENIEMKCRLFGISKKGYAEGILDRVGLLNVGKKKTKNFSLGMKQRLGIGMALVGEPDLLVLDEPINGLDPQGIAEVRDTIQNLCAQQQNRKSMNKSMQTGHTIIRTIQMMEVMSYEKTTNCSSGMSRGRSHRICSGIFNTETRERRDTNRNFTDFVYS